MNLKNKIGFQNSSQILKKFSSSMDSKNLYEFRETFIGFKILYVFQYFCGFKRVHEFQKSYKFQKCTWI